MRASSISYTVLLIVAVVFNRCSISFVNAVSHNCDSPFWIIIITIIITTLFKSLIILAGHECSTIWGDCKPNKSNQINESNKSNQIKCWFLRRGENRSTLRKTSRSRASQSLLSCSWSGISPTRPTHLQIMHFLQTWQALNMFKLATYLSWLATMPLSGFVNISGPTNFLRIVFSSM